MSFEHLVFILGTLIRFLDRVLSEFTNHIYNCPLCLAKGFICEICDHSTSNKNASTGSSKNCGPEEVTFPFSDDAKTCPDCKDKDSPPLALTIY